MNSITKAVFNELLECGKRNGKLTSQQINNAIEEIDVIMLGDAYHQSKVRLDQPVARRRVTPRNALRKLKAHLSADKQCH